MRTTGVLPWVGGDAASQALPLMIDVHSGPARFRFDGTVTDVASLGALGGTFILSGPSLASIGDAIGVTLPTTNAFRMGGALQRSGDVWNVRVDSATVGESRLSAALRYDARLKVPVLAGRVGGPRLKLVDLGPTIGGAPKGEAAAEVKGAGAKPGRVLPSRDFDLPSLVAMNANILFDFKELDLNTDKLEPLRPMRTHMTLHDGVLRFDDIEARTAEGRITGSVLLDGRDTKLAHFNTDLRWSGVRLDRWITQKRAEGSPPYIGGDLRGSAKLQGSGRSTAAILGSLKGQVQTELRKGEISHLLVEAAGLDVAQGLAVLFGGDKSLKVHCGLADLRAENGVLRPRAFVIDTDVTVVWLDGTVSLSTEALDLRAVVTPKNFSPLTLRTPVLVTGTMADPSVGLETKKLVPKLGIAAGLLALVNPLAAVLPLIDPGDKDAGARSGEDGCTALVARAAAQSGKTKGNVSPSAQR